MKKSIKFYFISLYFLFNLFSAFAQRVSIDFTNENYFKPLNYPKKSISEIKRKYYDFDTTGIQIPKNLETSSNFSVPVTIFSPVNFDSANFKCQSDFSDMTFNKSTNFHSAKFDSLATFFNSFFDTDVYFIFADFYSIVDFNSTHFLVSVIFFGVHFANLSRFEYAEFHRPTNFDGSQFDSFANFKNADIVSDINFNEVLFNSEVSFEGAYFGSQVNFTNTSFNKRLDLSNLITTNNTEFNFNHCVLPDTIDISNNNDTSLLLDFTSANFSLRFDSKTKTHQKHLINIYNTGVRNFKIDYIHFKLYLPDYFSYNEKVLLYEKLRQNFINNEQTEDIELLNKEIKDFKWAHLNFAQKFLQIFSDPLNVLMFTIAFWFLFTVVNLSLFRKLNNEVFSISFFDQDFPYLGNKTSIGKFGMHLFYSFIYTSIIYFSFRLDIGKIRFYNRRLLFWFGFIYSLGCLNLFLLAHLLFKN